MKKLTSILLCAALLLSLAACGGSGGDSASAPPAGSHQSSAPPAEATPFTLPIFPDFSLHPASAANRAHLTLIPLLYEGLFLVDEHFQAVPVLCQRYTVSEDGLTWTFTLRSGISFSDGSPLTGQAVASCLELARSPEGQYAQRLSGISSVSGTEQAVTIALSSPNGSLPLLLDIPIALGDGDRPVGTGPYVLSGPEDDPVLTLRGDWWQGKDLPLDTIPLRAVQRSDQLIYAFDAGDISLVDVDLMATNAIGYGGNYQTWDYATTDLLYLGFNARSGPCRDSKVRTALSLAVDRDAIAQTTYASHAVPSALPVHPDSPLYDAELARQLAYDPEVLATQLDSLGLRDRELVLLANSENSSKAAAAQLIAYQLEAAGVTVQVELLPFESYTDALSQGSFDLYLGETVLTADFDLSALLSPDGALNYGGWEDQTFGLLLSAARAASEDQAPQAFSALLTYLGRQVPIAPLVFKNGSVLTQWGRISGLDPLRGNAFYHMEEWNIS